MNKYGVSFVCRKCGSCFEQRTDYPNLEKCSDCVPHKSLSLIIEEINWEPSKRFQERI